MKEIVQKHEILHTGDTDEGSMGVVAILEQVRDICSTESEAFVDLFWTSSLCTLVI